MKKKDYIILKEKILSGDEISKGELGQLMLLRADYLIGVNSELRKPKDIICHHFVDYFTNELKEIKHLLSIAKIKKESS